MFIAKPRASTLRQLPFTQILGLDEKEALHVVRAGKRRNGRRVGAATFSACQAFATRHRELWQLGLV